MPETNAPLPGRFYPLDAPNISHEEAGGKAMNLVTLTRAGFPVPNGFIIPTTSYREFVDHSRLQPHIDACLEALAGTENLDRFEQASEEIQQAFLQHEPPSGFAADLLLAARRLDSEGLAVRSSATAEDLPQASFAGQQATYLNVVGEQALLEAVRNCWASLWTARALSYRQQNGIDHQQVALAVVVQAMVPSTTSGVMFTANPLTGLRYEIIVDAAFGLGEALVSGQVEPDQYVFDRRTQTVTEKRPGGKAILIQAAAGGGVERVPTPAPQKQALPDRAILELAQIGQRIEEMYAFPQDIEWAYVGDGGIDELAGNAAGEFFIVQSRPITSLYPLPDGAPLSPPRIFLSFGAVQGIHDPLTPLGMDTVRLLIAGGATLFGVQTDPQSQGVMAIAGSRLWADITGVLRHPLGARLVPRIFAGVEPGSVPTLETLLADRELGAGSGRFRFTTLLRAARFGLRMLRKVLYLTYKPEGKAARIAEKIQSAVQEFELVSRPPGGEPVSLRHALETHRRLFDLFPFAIPEIASALVAGLVPLLPLSRIAHDLTGSPDAALEITRGVPGNVTTEMDLALWRSSCAIKADPLSRTAFQSQAADKLAQAFSGRDLPAAAQQELARFLDRYGMRGLGEIDLGRPRWGEDPTPVIQSLQSYLLIEEGPQAPDVVIDKSTRNAEAAVDTLVAAARTSPFGRLKASLVRALALRVRSYAGLRESPKFYIVQVFNIVRRQLLEAGQSLVEAGTLQAADDVFYLFIEELEALARGEVRDWKSLVAGRREGYQREARRKQVPRLLVSDGRAFFQGMLPGSETGNILQGSGVSPGVVEGLARVVLNPHTAGLRPGEILVCPGTDPSWTPLFLAAGGLVMELGGLMTHGAIVAREYGIPAVVGVDQATSRIQTGERVRLDGSQGIVEIIEG